MSDVGRATREMTKQVGQSSKLSLEHTDAPSMPSMIIIAMLGLARLFAEGTVLYSQGVHGAVYALIAILVASTVSSIAGFVFSALSTTQAELDRKTLPSCLQPCLAHGSGSASSSGFPIRSSTSSSTGCSSYPASLSSFERSQGASPQPLASLVLGDRRHTGEKA
jgi:hypothetical protein